MKALVLAGGIPQAELIKQLKSRDIYTVLADGNKNAVAIPFADKFYEVDIFDIKKIKEIAEIEKVNFILTVCADQVLLVAAEVSEILGLPCYINYETGKNVSDKIRMKRIFKSNEIPTSNYVELDELDYENISKLRYPLIVKPVDAYSSKGVRKVNNLQELRKYYNEARNISRSGGVIVEEYINGQEISVDAFVLEGKVEVLTISNSEKLKHKDKFIIFRGRYPADIDENIESKIKKILQKIADAFQLTNSPLLVQLICDKNNNLFVLEFSARTGGNMKWLLIKNSCGIDVIKATIDITLGLKPDISIDELNDKIVVNDFIYCNEGVFDHLEGFEEMKNKGLINEYYAVRNKGTLMKEISSSSDRIAGINIIADSIDNFNKKQREILKSVKVIDSEGNDIMRRELLPDLE